MNPTTTISACKEEKCFVCGGKLDFRVTSVEPPFVLLCSLECFEKYEKDQKEYYCSCDSPGGTGFNCSICHKAIEYNWE